MTKISSEYLSVSFGILNGHLSDLNKESCQSGLVVFCFVSLHDQIVMLRYRQTKVKNYFREDRSSVSQNFVLFAFLLLWGCLVSFFKDFSKCWKSIFSRTVFDLFSLSHCLNKHLSAFVYVETFHEKLSIINKAWSNFLAQDMRSKKCFCNLLRKNWSYFVIRLEEKLLRNIFSRFKD